MKTSINLLTLAMAIALAAPAYADTVTTSGIGNTVNHSDSTVTTNSTNNTANTNNNNQHLTATGGNAAAFGGSAHSSSEATSFSSQKQGQLQGQTQSADNAGNAQAVTQNYEAQKRAPVSTAFAAPLVASGDCMGSSTAGGQGVGFGLSVGTTWHDEGCERRHDAITLHNLGQKAAAIALMCQDEKVADAMQMAGTPCTIKLSHVSQEREDPFHASGSPETHSHAASNKAVDGVIYEYPTSAKRW